MRKSLSDRNQQALSKGRRKSTCKGQVISKETVDYVQRKDKKCKDKGLDGYIPASCSKYGPRKGKCFKTQVTLKSNKNGKKQMVIRERRSRGSNSWIQYVNKIRKETNRKLGEILSDAKVRNEYKASKATNKMMNIDVS